MSEQLPQPRLPEQPQEPTFAREVLFDQQCVAKMDSESIQFEKVRLEERLAKIILILNETQDTSSIRTLNDNLTYFPLLQVPKRSNFRERITKTNNPQKELDKGITETKIDFNTQQLLSEAGRVRAQIGIMNQVLNERKRHTVRRGVPKEKETSKKKNRK